VAGALSMRRRESAMFGVRSALGRTGARAAPSLGVITATGAAGCAGAVTWLTVDVA
jgi:hypothetical protein